VIMDLACSGQVVSMEMCSAILVDKQEIEHKDRRYWSQPSPTSILGHVGIDSYMGMQVLRGPSSPMVQIFNRHSLATGGSVQARC
jgi:hypothetical protein